MRDYVVLPTGQMVLSSTCCLTHEKDALLGVFDFYQKDVVLFVKEKTNMGVTNRKMVEVWAFVLTNMTTM